MLMWIFERLKIEKCCLQAPCGSLKRKWEVVRLPKINCHYVLNLKQFKIWALKPNLKDRKLGWKVLILKYYLGKSFSKEMWCKMADTKKNVTTYFKIWKMHVIWGKSFLCPWTRKWFRLKMNGILEMSWFVHIFLVN